MSPLRRSLVVFFIAALVLLVVVVAVVVNLASSDMPQSVNCPYGEGTLISTGVGSSEGNQIYFLSYPDGCGLPTLMCIYFNPSISCVQIEAVPDWANK